MLTLSDTSLNYIEELNNEEKNFEPSFSLVINGHSLVCKKKTRENESIFSDLFDFGAASVVVVIVHFTHALYCKK